MCELKAEDYVRELFCQNYDDTQVFLGQSYLLFNQYQSPVKTRAIMAESQGLPEQYRDMSLEDLHGEIRRMEQLLRLLKEKVEVSEPRTSCFDTQDIDVHSTQRTETQKSLPCRVCREPGCTRSLKVQEYKRYGRQMIMPEVGLSGMLEPSPSYHDSSNAPRK